MDDKKGGRFDMMLYNIIYSLLGSAFSSPITWVLIVGVVAIVAATIFAVVKAKKNRKEQ
ncbi:MAG: hypothetical protein KBH85_07875 [Lachnospiraceae bacterium]|nr:hypothetical protein [Lachnospiraceae bacterium]